MENKAKKKLNTVDVLIIAVLLLAIAGIAARMLLIENTPDPMTLPDIEEQEYIVSYIVRNQRESVADYLAEGNTFRFALTNKVFGTTVGMPNTQNAEAYYFNSNGEYKTVHNNPDETAKVIGYDLSHLRRFDITGQFTVKGKLATDTGVLVINGAETETVALNKGIYIRSDEMIITVYITSIEPVIK